MEKRRKNPAEKLYDELRSKAQNYGDAHVFDKEEFRNEAIATLKVRLSQSFVEGCSGICKTTSTEDGPGRKVSKR